MAHWSVPLMLSLVHANWAWGNSTLCHVYSLSVWRRKTAVCSGSVFGNRLRARVWWEEPPRPKMSPAGIRWWWTRVDKAIFRRSALECLKTTILPAVNICKICKASSTSDTAHRRVSYRTLYIYICLHKTSRLHWCFAKYRRILFIITGYLRGCNSTFISSDSIVVAVHPTMKPMIAYHFRNTPNVVFPPCTNQSLCTLVFMDGGYGFTHNIWVNWPRDNVIYK